MIKTSFRKNVVGYSSADASGKTYMAVGPTFIDVSSSTGEFSVRSLKPQGDYDWQDDILFVVNPDTCEADVELCYLTKAEFPKLAEDGWYDAGDGTPYNDETFAIGTGFQSSFASGNDFSLMSSGQVHGDGYSVDCTGKVYQFLVNGTGRTITWGEIVPDADYDWQDDIAFIINPDTCEADVELCYLTKAEFPKLAEDGWYDAGDGTPYNDEELAPGEGFQTSFAAGGSFNLNFPAAF